MYYSTKLSILGGYRTLSRSLPEKFDNWDSFRHPETPLPPLLPSAATDDRLHTADELDIRAIEKFRA
jgi:hypothetical protein